MTTPTPDRQIVWVEDTLNGYHMKWDTPFFEAILASLRVQQRLRAAAERAIASNDLVGGPNDAALADLRAALKERQA
jgi:hypothetical protein